MVGAFGNNPSIAAQPSAFGVGPAQSQPFGSAIQGELWAGFSCVFGAFKLLDIDTLESFSFTDSPAGIPFSNPFAQQQASQSHGRASSPLGNADAGPSQAFGPQHPQPASNFSAHGFAKEVAGGGFMRPSGGVFYLPKKLT